MANLSTIRRIPFIVYTTGNQAISGIKNFTIRPQVNGSGVLLNGEAYPSNNPSGFITGVDLSPYATAANLASTGLMLNTKIDNLSGYSNNTFSTIANLEFTGLNLNQKIDDLSGVTVLTFSNQFIDGQKIFRGEVRIKDLYVTGTETIVNTTNTNVGSNYILLNATGGAIDAGIFIVTGSGLTGISDTGAIIGYDVPANRWVFGNASRDSDLSQLEKIAGITDIANYSGFVNSNFYPSNNPSGFITGVDLSQYLTGVDLSAYVTKSGGQFIDRPTLNGTGFLLSGEAASLPETIVYTTGDQAISGIKDFTLRPTVNGTGVLLSGEEQNIFKAGYIIYDSGNYLIRQDALHKNLNGKRGNFNLKNAIIPNLTSGDFVFYTIPPDSNLLKAYPTPAKPYFVVKNTDGRLDSYQPPEGGGAGPISSTNFINLNTDGPHSGLALQHVRFHPIIQNAYKKYYLTFGQDITVPMSNRYLESFIEIVWPSGQYWSVTNSGIEQYSYNVHINPPKATSFTQSHIVNFKITFEQDNRVGTVPNYDSRRIDFIYGSNLFTVSGANYEFIQKERCILTVNNGMQRW